jgi:hypothetical protein
LVLWHRFPAPRTLGGKNGAVQQFGMADDLKQSRVLKIPSGWGQFDAQRAYVPPMVVLREDEAHRVFSRL